MAMLDSFSLVLILFSLAVLGWVGELYLYIASSFADGLTTNPSIIGIKDTLVFFVSFIHSNFFVLALVLSLTNLVIGSRTSLNPVWAGFFAVISLILFWFLDTYLVPALFQTLFAMQTGIYSSNMHWAELFQSNWYMVALAGVLGTLIGYIRGVRNEADIFSGGARRWRRRY